MASPGSEDDDDYMSDAILAKCPDTRPGLVSKKVASQYKKEIKQKESQIASRTKPRKQVEHEKRDEGLQKSLGADNKGFALLAKMGYKPGTGIGKSGAGRVEPVPVELKSGRSGLGHDTEVTRKRNAHAAKHIAHAQKRQRQMANMQSDFLHRHQSRFSDKEAERDLGKSQRVCEQLDAQKGIEQPQELYFWPAYLLPSKKKKANDLDEDGEYFLEEPEFEDDEEEEEEEEEEDTLTTQEKLGILTEYLRCTHIYCIWCGTAYNDEEDLKQNCPGNTAADHD